jgi:hypothetical protein
MFWIDAGRTKKVKKKVKKGGQVLPLTLPCQHKIQHIRYMATIAEKPILSTSS